jgi:phage repressor protein C with HTH and peptisase S24 domain
MVTAFVQFKVPERLSRERAKEVFTGTAPSYQNAEGLIRKYYLLSEDGGTAGGVYLWKSKEDAEKLYSQAWKNFIKEKYGADPSIVYFQSPVVVDNLTREIIND